MVEKQIDLRKPEEPAEDSIDMGLVERFSQHASFVTKKVGGKNGLKNNLMKKVDQFKKSKKPNLGDEQSGGGLFGQNEDFDDMFAQDNNDPQVLS